MRVFVTGATGFVGSAVVKELIGAGHQVLGLVRSDANAKLLAAAGAEVHRGSLEDLDSLSSGAAASDGVIHTAFIHDFSNFVASCEADRAAIEAIGTTLRGSGKPFIITSGLAGFNLGRPVVETDLPDPAIGGPRAASEGLALSFMKDNVRASVVRLSPSVHDDGDYGFVPMLINIAREKGVSAYIGDGKNRWPAVHRLDAAHAYRLILEKAKGGSRYHAVGDAGIPTRTIAETIGKQLNLPVVSKSPEEAMAHFGFLGRFFSMNVSASCKLTEDELSWKATHKGLIEDLDTGTYFK